MTASIIPGSTRPQVKSGDDSGSQFSKVGTILGGIGGAVAGGPGGYMAGAAAGASLGGLAGGLLGRNTPDTVVGGQQVQPISTDSESAMSRRYLKVAEQDPYEAIKQANLALEYAPKEIQDAYKGALNEGLTLAMKQQSTGRIG